MTQATVGQEPGPLPAELLILSGDDVPPAVIEILGALSRAPADEQRARVAALREMERTCAAGDRRAVLVGPGAS